MDIQLIETETKVPAAFIFGATEGEKLSEFRLKANEQAGELLPNNYSFVYSGTKVTTAQETQITIGKACTLDGNHMVLEFVSKDWMADSELPSTSSTSSTSTSTSSTTTSKTSTTSFLSHFRAQEAHELRGLKVYTDKELQRSTGKEKEYRISWNAEMKIFAKDRKLTRTDIANKINENWSFSKQDKKQKAPVNKTVIEAMSTKEGGTSSKRKRATIDGNLIRYEAAEEMLEKTKTEIKALDRQIGECVIPKRKEQLAEEREKLDAKVKGCLSELRKVKDTMRKNLKVTKKKLDEAF